MKKRLLCRIGFHQAYGNTCGVNLGTDDKPVYMMRTEQRCNYCDWSSANRISSVYPPGAPS